MKVEQKSMRNRGWSDISVWNSQVSNAMGIGLNAENSAPIEEQFDQNDAVDIRLAIEQMKRGEVIDWKRFSEQLRVKFLNVSKMIRHKMPAE